MSEIERNPMPLRAAAPQRLTLHPDIFGQAFPESRELRPEWLPSNTTYSITSTEEEFSILCPERFIPLEVEQVRGLRVLFLHPEGAKISQVIEDIDEELRRENIPATATFNYRIDLGFMVVSGDDLPCVRSLLTESGHSVEEPPAP